MIEANRQLVTNELVEFEKQPVKVEDYRKINRSFLEESIEYTPI